MRKIFKGFYALLSVAVLFLLSAILYANNSIPDRFVITQGQQLQLHGGIFDIQPAYEAQVMLSSAGASPGQTYQVPIKLMGTIPVKTVRVEVVNRQSVVPAGIPFGIKMFTEGVIVVGMSDIPTQNGRQNPAKDAGLKIGDVILSIGGNQLNSKSQVEDIIASAKGSAIALKVRRADVTYTLQLKPALSTSDNQYRAGIWLRDSSAGIGTMTYYDPATGLFTGLGHPVCDVDTGELMPLDCGEIVDVSISGVVKGQSGTPGELQGSFVSIRASGILYANTPTGVYGTIQSTSLLNSITSTAMPIAMKQEIKTGPATILATVEGNTPKEYTINIDKVELTGNQTKNMVIRVTDPALIAQTGGIVQGMSGSPIIQNNMLVGSVTHVFVNDPLRGFAIFAENVYRTGGTVEIATQQAS